MEDNNEYRPNLMPCPNCGHQISMRAEKCPHCGCVINHSAANNNSQLDVQSDKHSAPKVPPIDVKLDKGASIHGTTASNIQKDNHVAPEVPPLDIKLDKGASTASGASSSLQSENHAAPEVPPLNVKSNTETTSHSKDASTSNTKQSSSTSGNNKPTSNNTVSKPTPQVQLVDTPSRNRKVVIWLIIVLSLIIIGVSLIFCYKNIFLPNKIDREAPRYYSYVPSLILRSSQSSGADYNKISSLPYGTELILYDKGEEWSSIKVNEENADGDKLKGYVSSMYILDKHDFALLNSIFGDVESKEVISTAKCRLALLNYFKENKYIGKISDEERTNAGIEITPNTINQWQVYSKGKNQKTNTTYFKRLYNKESKYTDFAVIIENVNIENRKLLYFYFDDDETPHLLYSEDVPFGYKYIKKIKINQNYGSVSVNVEYVH